MLGTLVFFQETESPSFAPLLIITALAAFIPLVTDRLKVLPIPVIVGEILVGILLGESGLGIIRESSYLTFLAEFGFVYLMFLSGLEIDFSRLRSNELTARRGGALGNPINLGLAVFAGTVALAFLISLLLGVAGMVKSPLIMALILSTTSVGVVVPVLRDAGLTAGSFGQSILLSALVADFSTMLLITVAIAAAAGGVTPELLLILVLFVAFFGAWRVGAFLRRGHWRQLARTPRAAAAEERTRLAFALMIFFVVLSQWVGAEVILGAFLAGAAISLISHHESRTLEGKLSAIGFGFLIPIFFIYTGANFDLEEVLGSSKGLLLVPILLAAAYAVKVLPALLYARAYSMREALSAGLLLSSRLSLIIAAAAIGVRVGAVSEAVAAAVILVAVFTCTLSPILFTKVYRASEDTASGFEETRE
jgi:Kef-type K+ transport system membrane component KefB